MPKNIIVLFLFILFMQFSFAQEKNYRINGTVRTQDGKFKDAYVAVNGVKHYMDSLGNYDVKLPFQEENILIYGCKGSVQQRIEFNTTVSKERIEDAFYPKEINVVLFDKVEGVDIALMQEPIEKYAYNEDQYDFDNDEAYALDMNAKVQTLKEVLAVAKKNGGVSADLAAKTKQDAEQQKLIQEQAKLDAIEKQRLEKERMALELAMKKKEQDALDAEETARRKEERAKRKREEAEQERIALRQSFEQDSIYAADAKREKKEAEAKRLEELRLVASKDSLVKAIKEKTLKDREEARIAEDKATQEATLLAKASKEKALQEAAAKRQADEKARQEILLANKTEKEKLAIEAEEKRLAAEKIKQQEFERIKKEKEEQARLNAQLIKDKEAEEAKRKADEMAALKEKLKENNLDAGQKRLEQLAAQEELFKKRQSKFQPVMGIYTTTTSVINGKKAYGYINFGNGLGNQDLTKEEFEAYKEKFKKP